MWILEKVGDTFNVPVKQYLVTEQSDLNELPAGALGDRAVFTNGTIVYYDPETGWQVQQ